MGLFIGSASTNPVVVHFKGNFSADTAYLNINEYYRPKDGDKLNLGVHLYKSKADREAGYNPISAMSGVSNSYSLDCTVSALTENDLFVVSYSKLKDTLEDVYGEGNIYNDI